MSTHNERGAAADYHVRQQRAREEADAAKAQVLIDAFVARAKAAGLPTTELTAAPWSGRGRYRVGVTGWYLRKNQSVGVDTDGRYYVLVVPNDWRGRFRGVHIEPSLPPLEVGRGGRDGECIALDVLLENRLTWPTD